MFTVIMLLFVVSPANALDVGGLWKDDPKSTPALLGPIQSDTNFTFSHCSVVKNVQCM